MEKLFAKFNLINKEQFMALLVDLNGGEELNDEATRFVLDEFNAHEHDGVVNKHGTGLECFAQKYFLRTKSLSTLNT